MSLCHSSRTSGGTSHLRAVQMHLCRCGSIALFQVEAARFKLHLMLEFLWHCILIITFSSWMLHVTGSTCIPFTISMHLESSWCTTSAGISTFTCSLGGDFHCFKLNTACVVFQVEHCLRWPPNHAAAHKMDRRNRTFNDTPQQHNPTNLDQPMALLKLAGPILAGKLQPLAGNLQPPPITSSSSSCP